MKVPAITAPGVVVKKAGNAKVEMKMIENKISAIKAALLRCLGAVDG